MQPGSLTLGTVVAQRFEVADRVSSGGMGTVFRARDLLTGQPVALKLLTGSSGSRQEQERFAREAQVLSELRHPGIVSYVAHGMTPDGQPFLAMELLAGVDLAERLSHGSLSIADCLVLLRKTAEALAAAHRRGIVHRDIKPSNLFLRDGLIERVVLLDFGIARDALSGRAMTRTGIVIGTPEYMAPEQARGQRDVGPSADIFSLGCVLYECLTGQPPFVGAHMAAQLAKILFEEATPVRKLRSAVPVAMEALLMRMLAKLPEARPRDAEVLLKELQALEEVEVGIEVMPALMSGKVRTSLVGNEQQLVSVVVGALRRSLVEGMETLGWEDAEQIRAQRAALTGALCAYGVQIEWLADGSMVATLTNAGTANDQAAQAARCALALQERWPDSLVALATGRGVLHQTMPVGEAIDRAFALLRSRVELSAAQAPPAAGVRTSPATLPEGVWLDEVTAGLLDARFPITRVGQQALLPGERVSADQTRLLLGKPTPCVGREQELAVLDVVLSGCINDSTARAVLVTSPPGMGKSRLRHEFLRRLQSRSEDITILIGRGDPMTSGSPYALLAEALRRECGVLSGEPLELQRTKLRERLGRHLPAEPTSRIIEFLGELCGVPFSDEQSVLLRAARQDPKIMSEQVNLAFVDLLRAETSARPVLLVLEDLHWGDMLTVKLVDGALRDLDDRPLMVVALARPEASKLFPALWQERGLQELRLTALNKKASERLVTQVLGSRIGAETLARIVEQAAGNALFLEELIRAVAEGKGNELPGTVLAMVQARLLRLEPGARRLLRAASIFGETFWGGGLLTLSVSHTDTTQGGNTEVQEVDAWLQVLVEAEAIERHRESRFPQETEYGFRHALLREAAYSMLTEDDRRLGHMLAGTYLEAAGERDPMVLAEHFRRADDRERALPYYLRAADQSYDSNDLEGALQRAERGVAGGATGELLGSLRVLQMLVNVWRTEWDTAYVHGKEALQLVPAGSYRWCKAMGHMLGISAMMSQPDPAVVMALVNSFLSTEPRDEARGAYIEAASIVLTMFSWGGQRDASRYLQARMEGIARPILEHDATARGWLEFSHSSYLHMMEPDPQAAMQRSLDACESFKQAGDGRNQVFSSSLLGQTLYALGRADEGQAVLRAGLALAERLGEAYAISWARIHLALMLSRHSEAAPLAEAHAIAAGNLQSGGLIAAYRGWAHNILARVLLRRDKLAEAEAEAEQGRSILVIAPMWQLESLGTLIRIRLRQGRVEAALELAEAVTAQLAAVGSAGHIEVAVRLARAEALHAAGEQAAAEQALRETLGLIEQRAAGISDPTARQRFLEQVPENAEARALAGRWLGGRRSSS